MYNLSVSSHYHTFAAVILIIAFYPFISEPYLLCLNLGRAFKSFSGK